MIGWLLTNGPANPFIQENAAFPADDIFKTNRAAALADWRGHCSAERDVV